MNLTLEASLTEVESLPDQEAADALDAKIRRLEAILRTAFMELGYIASVIQKRKLWQYLKSPKSGHLFTSFDEWLLDAAPYSRSHCYAAKGIYEELAESIPRQTLMKINETNARTLLEVSSTVRPKLAESAVVLSEDQLRQTIQKDFPQQHVERKRTLTFHLSESAYQVVTDTLNYIGSRLEISDRDGQIEALCADFSAEHSEDDAA